MLARGSDWVFAIGCLLSLTMALFPGMWVGLVAALTKPEEHHDRALWPRWLHRSSWRVLGAVLLVLFLLSWLALTVILRAEN